MIKKFETLKLVDITPTKDNARKIDLKAPDFLELVESIKANGVLVPIIVQARSDQDGYTIRAGERRYRASVAAGKEWIDALIIHSSVSHEDVMKVTMIENSNRKDLSLAEQITEVSTFADIVGEDVQAMASVMQVPESHVRQLLNARKHLNKSIRDAINAGESTFSKLTLAHLGCIGRLTKEQQEVVLQNPRWISGWNNKICTVAELESRLSSEFRDSLTGVAWAMDQQFKGLKKCSECPLRSDHDRELFEDLIEEKKGKVNVKCLNKECMDQKRIATMKDQLALLEIKHPGIKVHFSDNLRNTMDKSVVLTALLGKPKGTECNHSWDREFGSHKLDRVKKDAKGAVPIAVPAASGKVSVTWVKGSSKSLASGTSAGASSNGGVKTMKERRAVLESKRWHRVNGIFVKWMLEQEHQQLDLSKIPHDLGKDSGYFEFFALFVTMTDRPHDYSVRYDWFDQGFKGFSRDYVVENLWPAVRGHLVDTINCQGQGVTQLHARHIKKMGQMASWMNYDIDAEYQRAKEAIQEPKIWASLGENGLPKTSK